MKSLLIGFNMLLAFLLELAMLAVFGYSGFHIGDSLVVHLLLGIGLPFLVITIWSLWFAPRANNRLKMPWLAVGKVVLFGLSAALLYKVDQHFIATLFAGAVAVHFLLLPLGEIDAWTGKRV